MVVKMCFVYTFALELLFSPPLLVAKNVEQASKQSLWHPLIHNTYLLIPVTTLVDMDHGKL